MPVIEQFGFKNAVLCLIGAAVGLWEPYSGGLMYPAQESGDTRRKYDDENATRLLALRCENRPPEYDSHRPVLYNASVWCEDSFELRTGRAFEAFRPTDLWYPTMKAGGMPQTRSRSLQKAISQTLQIQ